MTIKKGEPWGAPGALPSHGVIVRCDTDAAAEITAARRAQRPIPPLGLLGGDLRRTLGGPGSTAMTFPMDLGEAVLDGELHYFVAHLVVRRPLWLGRSIVVMNAAWLGDLNLGPKAHPNDGLLDITTSTLRPRELRAARDRARTGSHLPHPRLATSRVPTAQFRFAHRRQVRLDGRLIGAYRDVSVSAVPDALTVVL
jgi:hypothetical protein